MKVSIITVCYNSKTYIQTTIESVLSQTYSDIEYIIVDGESTDGTIEIIKKNESRFESGRLKWISEPDHGIYDAMNKGIRLATGEIVGVLNSDDFYNNSLCIKMIADVLKDPNIDCCFGDMRYVKPENINKTVRYYSSSRFHPNLFRFGYMPGHATFFVRTKYFERIGYYKSDYQISADYELLIRFLYIHKLKYKYIPSVLIIMRNGGISTRSWKSNYILNKEIVKACKENGIYTNLFILSLKYFRKIFEFIHVK